MEKIIGDGAGMGLIFTTVRGRLGYVYSPIKATCQTYKETERNNQTDRLIALFLSLIHI